MNSHRNQNKNIMQSPNQNVFETKDLKITKNMMNKIQKRTRAAVKQAMQGEQSKKPKEFKVFSPLPNKSGCREKAKKKRNARSREKFTNFERKKLEKPKKRIRRVSQENIETGSFKIVRFFRCSSGTYQELE